MQNPSQKGRILLEQVQRHKPGETKANSFPLFVEVVALMQGKSCVFGCNTPGPKDNLRLANPEEVLEIFLEFCCFEGLGLDPKSASCSARNWL